MIPKVGLRSNGTRGTVAESHCRHASGTKAGSSVRTEPALRHWGSYVWALGCHLVATGSGSLWTGFSLSPLSLLSLCLATRPTSSSFRPCFLQRNLSYHPGTVSQSKTPFTLVAFGWGYPITETKMPITRGGSRTAAVRMASSVYTSVHI